MAAGELSPPPDGLDGAAALCRYEGPATKLVTSLKYGRHRDAVRPIGAALAVMGGTWLDGATVCWVPAEPTNRAERGFDQGELLARATTDAALRRAGSRVAVAALLRREPAPATAAVRPSPPHGEGRSRPDGGGQTGRTRAERLAGPVLVPAGPAPTRVVVVDDVTTTGASLSRAAAALRGAGAQAVFGLCVAATPYQPTPHR